MNIYIMTLFPEMFNDFLKTSILGKAINKKLINIKVYNIRDYSTQTALSVDDYAYGGGAGMLMMCQPIVDCYNDIKKNICDNQCITFYMSPRGKILNSKLTEQFCTYKDIIILCGHYEGVDIRAIKLINAIELSIGDYVLTGGELPAMVFIDSIVRRVDGVLHNSESIINESHTEYLLEYDQYTRPEIFNGLKVPDVLLSGNHKKIDEYRKQNSIDITKINRPDLFEKYINRNND